MLRRVLLLVRPHTRWRRDLSAFADGELPAERGRLVQAHLVTCAACTAEAEAVHSLKLLLSEAGVPAPRRSFQVTAATLARAEDRPVPANVARRPPALLLHTAQATAAVAVIAFGVVLAADVSSTGGSEDAKRSASLAATGEGSVTRQGASDSAVGDASGVNATAAAAPVQPRPAAAGQPGAGGAASPAPPELKPEDRAASGAETTTTSAWLAEPAPTRDDNGQPGWRVAEAVLGALTLSALVVAGVSYLQRRRSER